MLTKKYALFLKSDFEIAHFLTSFFDKIVSKTQNNFFKQNEAWHKPQKIISSSKIKFHNMWKKSTTIATIFKKLWLFFDFSNFPLFGSFALVHLPEEWNNWLYPATIFHLAGKYWQYLQVMLIGSNIYFWMWLVAIAEYLWYWVGAVSSIVSAKIVYISVIFFLNYYSESIPDAACQQQ